MPIPFIIGGIALCLGATGVVKGVEAKRNYDKAGELNESSERKVRIAKRMIENAKENAKNSIESLGRAKLEILSTSIKDFINYFEKIKNISFKKSKGINELKHLTMTPDTFKAIKNASFEAQKIAAGGLASAGAGAATACLTYGAVGYLGTASTGAAITGLSGAAATNATLAWLGGGSVASGGYGIAGGMVVLGGLVVGPALAIGGFLLASQSKTALNNAESNYAESKKFKKQAELIETSLNGIAGRAGQITEVLEKLDSIFKEYIRKMSDTINRAGNEWADFKKMEQEDIYRCVQIALTIKSIIDAPLLDKNGKLDENSAQVIENGNEVLQLSAGR